MPSMEGYFRCQKCKEELKPIKRSFKFTKGHEHLHGRYECPNCNNIIDMRFF